MDNHVPVIGPYILHALNGTKIQKAGAGLISDFCTMVQSEKIIDGFKDYTPALLKMLTDPTIEREGKLAAIVAIADTISMTKDRFEPFYADTFKLFFGAAKKSIEDFDDHDREYMLYCTQLQGTLIEAFVCITQEFDSLSEISREAFLSHIEPLMEFLVGAAGQKYSPTEERIRDIIGLFGDLAKNVR